MSTDELLDDPDLDRALRALLPRMPRSAAWEACQRDALVAFIDGGEVIVRPVRDSSAGEPPVRLHPALGERHRSRAVVLAGAAAAVALLAVGLAVAPRWRSADLPTATVPTVTDVGLVPVPDRYPVLPPDHPMEARAVARFDGQAAWDNASAVSIVIGRLADDALVDSVTITAFPTLSDRDLGLITNGAAGEPIDVVGVGGTVYGDVLPGATAAVLQDDLTLLLVGSDPLGFLERVGAVPVSATADAGGGIAMEVGQLPDGYEVIAEPEPFVPGALDARLTVPDGEGPPDPTMPDPIGDEGDGITVVVTRNSPLTSMAVASEQLDRVDIGGSAAWLDRGGREPSLAWKVSGSTWAFVSDAASPEAALAFARSLDFVDRTTWMARYAVPGPAFPAGPAPGSDRNEAIADQIALANRQLTAMLAAAGFSDLDRRACATVGMSPSNFERRVEVDCGSADGLRVGMPVVNSAGLVGKVTTVALDSSVVMLLTDPEFSVQVSVEGGGSRSFGVLRGVGGDRLPQVTLVGAGSAPDQPGTGDAVTTAGGSDSVAPANIPIGHVATVDESSRIIEVDARPDLASGSLTVLLFTPDREVTSDVTATTAPSLIALEETGAIPTDVPIACGSTPPRDETIADPVVAATPQEALGSFVWLVEPGLWKHGWIHTWTGDAADPHRFDYHREDGQLVTVVYVEPVDGGWAATRWLSTPC